MTAIDSTCFSASKTFLLLLSIDWNTSNRITDCTEQFRPSNINLRVFHQKNTLSIPVLICLLTNEYKKDGNLIKNLFHPKKHQFRGITPSKIRLILYQPKFLYVS